MECSAGERAFVDAGGFPDVPLMEDVEFFGDFAAAVASCIATNELERAHAAMKQSDRHASHLPTDRLRRFTFSASSVDARTAFTGARVVLPRAATGDSAQPARIGANFNQARVARARLCRACSDQDNQLDSDARFCSFRLAHIRRVSPICAMSSLRLGSERRSRGDIAAGAICHNAGIEECRARFTCGRADLRARRCRRNRRPSAE